MSVLDTKPFRHQFYTKNQILWGLLGIVLFGGSILILNIKGYTHDPVWLTMPVLSKSPSPLAQADNVQQPVQIPLQHGLVYGLGDTVWFYDLLTPNPRPIATLSGEIIGDIGLSSDGNIYLISGSKENMIDSIYVYQDRVFNQHKINPVPNYIAKPIYNSKTNSLYWWSNTFSGHKLLMVSNMDTGTQEEIVQSSMPIIQMAVSSDARYIALNVEMFQANGTKVNVLGLVANSARNINLFPSVELEADSKLFFSKDNKVIFSHTPDKVIAFSINTTKIIDTIAEAKILSKNTSDEFWLGKFENKGIRCDGEILAQKYFDQVIRVNFENDKFAILPDNQLLNQLMAKKLLISSSGSTYDNGINSIFKIFDQQKCKLSWQYYNIKLGDFKIIPFTIIDNMPLVMMP